MLYLEGKLRPGEHPCPPYFLFLKTRIVIDFG